MGELFSYSIAAAMPLAAMYLIYKGMLASENQHRWNRTAIWLIYVTAMLLPAISPIATTAWQHATHPHATIVASTLTPIVEFGEAQSAIATWPSALLTIYLSGTAVSAALTLFTFRKLWLIIHHGDKLNNGHHTIIITADSKIAPFSWWRHIVINREDYNEAGQAIILHETKHLDSRHWIDLLAAQLIAIFQWYNPAAWLLREELKTVHEYQADESVLSSGTDIRQYQMLLIKKAVGARFPSLANSLNHSNLKKRITMMYKSKPSPWRRMRAMALIPAAAIAVAVSNIPAVASVLSDVSEASLPSASHKVTEIQSKDKKPEEVTVIAYPNDQEIQINDNSGNSKSTETMPEYKGGEEAMMKFLTMNLRYPEAAAKAKAEGRVTVKFTVSPTGKIESPEILQGVTPELDAEALRVVSIMPDFTPGLVDGIPVACSYALPIHFALQ